MNDTAINNLSLIFTTWLGFHKARRKQGLSIAQCYVVLCGWFLTLIDRDISERSLRNVLVMYHHYYLRAILAYLVKEGYFVLTRQSKTGRYKYYSLTDKGNTTALDLLNGIEAKQAEFFNKYLK